MKNWKLISVLMLSVMLMASGCDKTGPSSPDDSAPSTTAGTSASDPEVSDEAQETEKVTTTTGPVVTRADGGIIDSDVAVDGTLAETKPAEETKASAPEESKEQIVEIIDDSDIETAGGNSEEIKKIIDSAVSEDKNSDVDAPDISGEWIGGKTEANNISIEKVEGNVYTATLIINKEKGSGMLWEFVLRYEDGKYVYSNGKKYDFSVKDGSLSSTEAYSDGTGSLMLEEDHLIWTDDKEDQGRDIVFIKE